MAETRTFRLRVTYGKTGRLAMLSHLEITHALERIVRRARLPFALSQGFSPHMKISFGSALPVGIGGTQEIFDIALTDYVSPAKCLDALQAASPEGLMPVSCKYVDQREKAASVAYPRSTYVAAFDQPLDGWAVPEEVTVIRKKKEKVLLVDDYLIGDAAVNGCDVVFTLESGDSGNLRPDVFLNACLGILGGNPPQLVSITRVSQE